jgi:hypothetical protein
MVTNDKDWNNFNPHGNGLVNLMNMVTPPINPIPREEQWTLGLDLPSRFVRNNPLAKVHGI